jgi:flagellum-specific peptidoglycan hydrolase FlgJ
MSNAFNIDKDGNILGSRGFTPFGGATNAQGQFTGSPISQQQYNDQLNVAGLGVAGPSALQQQSYQGAAGLQTPGAYCQAQQAAGYGAGQAFNMANNATPQDFQNQVGGYMNPYIQQSLAPQLAEMQRQYGITGTQQAGQATQQGAFGGGRDAIMEAENERNKNTAMNQAIAQGYNNAFTQAQNQYNQSGTFQLQANQAGVQNAGTQANIAGQGLQAQQGIIGLQNQMGAQEQQNQQAVINQALQNYSNQQQYPQQQTANIMNLIRSTPTTQTQTAYAAPPSALSQTAGLAGTALAGYKLAGASGGMPEDFEVKRMAGGGIASGVPPGKLQSMLADLSDQQLAQKANPQASDLDTLAAVQGEQAFRANARASMPSTPGFAPGGIVAFAEGGRSRKEAYAGESQDDDLINSILMSGLSEGMMPSYTRTPVAPQEMESSPRASGNVSPASTTGKAFYNEILSSARNYAEKMGARNPDAVAHVIATQAAAESGWGKNLSGQNNIFGIKGKGTVRSTLEDYGQGKVRVNQEFKDYPSISDATKDAVNLMATSPRYAKVWNARDPIEGLNAQATSGYATAKDYGQLLHGVYKKANMAEGGEVKGFSGDDDKSLVKPDGSGKYANKQIAEDAASLRGIGNFLTNAPQNVFSAMNPITGIIQKGKDFIDWAKETPEEQYQKYYPELAAKKKQEKLEAEGRERRRKLGGMTDEELVKYNEMNANENARNKIKQDLGVFNNLHKQQSMANESTVNPIVKSTGTSAVINPVAPTVQQAEMGPPKDLMDDKSSTTTGSPVDRYSELLDMLKGQQKQVGEQKQQDKWLALLEGSLGTMAGTSPYALQNIGAGGQKGIASYAASNKQRAAEQSDILGQMVSIEKGRSIENYQKNQLAQSAMLRRDEIDARLQMANLSSQDRRDLLAERKRYNDIVDQNQDIAQKERTEARQDKNKQFNMSILERMQKDAQTRALADLKLNPLALSGKSAEEIYAITAPKIQEYLNIPRYRELHKNTYGYDPYENTKEQVDPTKRKPLTDFQK